MIYLASRSPRRRELLPLIGVRFRVLDVEVDETPRRGEAPRAYVLRLARAKAAAAWGRHRRAPILAADTTVTVGRRLLEKPADAREAAGMLRALSGRWHKVFTAIAAHDGKSVRTALSISEVRFKKLSRKDIRAYLSTREWQGKAGAYAIQG